MYGYVKPYTEELRVKEALFYRATYCGICREMRRTLGELSGLTLTYDSVFLALVRMVYLPDEAIGAKDRRCALHPLKKRRMLERNDALSYTARVFALLSYHKCLDDGADERGAYEPSFCPHCGACKKACPMSEGLGCLSMVTQKKGELTPEERDFILRHGSAWGCDICSAVCPYTKKAIAEGNETPIEFFRRDRIVHLTSGAVNAMDKAAFRERAFAWRGKKTVLRNLEIFGE
jgi:formate hydrogenlyase subunit 6/NADH:ubiquinone oxidoreductase subunit I